MLFVFVAIKLWILQESKYPLVLQTNLSIGPLPLVMFQIQNLLVGEAPLCLIVVDRQHPTTQKSQILNLLSHHEPLHGQKEAICMDEAAIQ
jgi:hypothetical protein